jgi:hypothetical protein
MRLQTCVAFVKDVTWQSVMLPNVEKTGMQAIERISRQSNKMVLESLHACRKNKDEWMLTWSSVLDSDATDENDYDFAHIDEKEEDRTDRIGT